MTKEITIHYFQTSDEEWLCAVQEPQVHACTAMSEQLSALAAASHDQIPKEGDEHLAVLARIAIHHAMRAQGEPEREFTLEFLPPVVKMQAPVEGMGASLLNLFEGVTVWRQAD
jgi:hypothetical protein